jgi:chromosome segregation ATPase
MQSLENKNMEQNGLQAQLTSLERKMKLLINDYQQVKKEVSLLQSENNSLKSGLQEKEEQINNFQNTIKIGKIVGSIDTEEGNSSQLKHRVDDYIREIDKCIAHLSK